MRAGPAAATHQIENDAPSDPVDSCRPLIHLRAGKPSSASISFARRLQRGERHVERRARKRKRDAVAVVHFRQRDHAAVEGFVQTLHVAHEARMIAEQIHRHHARVGQTRARRAIEADAVEHRAARGRIVDVDLQRADRAVIGAVVDEVPRVGFVHGQARVVVRQLEHRARGHHDRRVHFDRLDLRALQEAVRELGQRRRAQTELDDALRAFR